jgi:predicted permease
MHLLRILLLACPSTFRRRYGPEVLELCEARRHRLVVDGAGATTVARFWLRTTADVGMTAAAEWRDVARRKFLRNASESRHNPQRISMYDRLTLDTREAVKRLAGTPGFTVAALAILSLGIGANAAIFGAVDAVAFRPLPFVRPHELVHIYQDSDDGRPSSNAYPAYLDVAAVDDLFTGVGAVMPEGTATLATPSGEAVLLHVEYATSSYLPVLGLQPFIGRWFASGEDFSGAPPVAVVSYDAWRRRFGRDPNILGQAVRLSGATVTIVGVGPQNYDSVIPGLAAEFWLSISSLGPVGGAFRGATLTSRQDHWFQIVARVKPERTFADAQAAMNVLAERISREFPETDRGRRITVMRSNEVRVHPEIDAMLFPAAGVPMVLAGLVLVVACSNLANLLLVRGAARRREFGVRLALGASRAQLVRGLLVESVLLAAAGGSAGLVLAQWMLKGLAAAQLPLPLVVSPTFSVDTRVILFGIILSVITGVSFGLWPALGSTRRDVITSLKDASDGAEPRRRGASAVRGVLVVVQVAVSLALLTGGGLLLRSVLTASSMDLGFDPGSVSVMTIDVGQAGQRAETGAALIHDIRVRVSRLPGVEVAALSTRIPLTPFGPSTSLVLDEHAVHAPADRRAEIEFTAVSPDYFSALRLPLRHGRLFTDADRRGTEAVAIVSETMARRFWGTTDVVDRRYRHEGQADLWVRIVGVVGDVPIQSAGETPRPFLYRPAAQRMLDTATLVVRTSVPPSAVLPLMRNEVRSVNSLIPMVNVGSMDDHIQRSLALPRTAMQLLLGFAALAVVLACVGVYSVVAFSVARRQKEMGVRMAVGASSSQVVTLVVREMMILVGLGTAIGLVLAGLLAPALRSLLVGIQPFDAVTFIGVCGVIVFVAVISTWLPARQAGRADLAGILRT